MLDLHGVMLEYVLDAGVLVRCTRLIHNDLFYAPTS